MAIKNVAACGTTFSGTGAVTLFTVTGSVIVRLWAVVGGTQLTSTSNDGTISIGTADSVAALLAAATINGSTNFIANSVWVDTTPATTCEAFAGANTNWAPVGNSTNIISTVATHGMTAGVIAFYCQWIPASVGATVVAA